MLDKVCPRYSVIPSIRTGYEIWWSPNKRVTKSGDPPTIMLDPPPVVNDASLTATNILWKAQ